VHRPTRLYRVAIARHLAGGQPRHPEIVRDPEEYHEVEERDIDVSPAAERARKHPAARLLQIGAEQRAPRLALPDVLERRLGRQPEIGIDVVVQAAQP
jgi:hypothetical protein